MQSRHEPVTLILIDDEGDVEIVRRLSDEIDLLLFEQFEGIAQAMQDCANVAPHEAHGSARTDRLYATEPSKIGDEHIERRLVERVRRWIEGHRDARFGGRHEIDG